MQPDTVTVHLGTGYGNPLPSLLWEALLERALPVVEHYRSDLYWDAQWLDKYVTGPEEFYFGVHKYGTHIGTDLELIKGYSDVTYHVTVTVTDTGRWEAVITS